MWVLPQEASRQCFRLIVWAHTVGFQMVTRRSYRSPSNLVISRVVLEVKWY